MTGPIYAIGDIHGQLGMLELALARIELDGGADARVVFLGDYVDRGPDSAGVISRLIKGIEAGRDWICLKGNHDRMFEWFMLPEPRHDPHLLIGYHWFHEKIGGVETMASYGVTWPELTRLYQLRALAGQAVPQSHVEFLQSLKIYHQEGDLLFVHAGIRPGVPLAEQSEDDLLWIRKEFHIDPVKHPWLVVHGHTPVKVAMHYGNRVNLDSGAGYGKPLSVAVFEEGTCYLLTAEGRQPLRPSGSI